MHDVVDPIRDETLYERLTVPGLDAGCLISNSAPGKRGAAARPFAARQSFQAVKRCPARRVTLRPRRPRPQSISARSR